MNKRFKITAERWEIVDVDTEDENPFDCEEEMNEVLYDRIVNDDKCFDKAYWYIEDFGEVKEVNK